MIDFALPREGQTQGTALALLAGGREKAKDKEMPNERMLKAKLDYFAQMKKDAAMCLIEMGAKLGSEHVEPDSKAGMIALVAFVKRHKPTVEEELAADLAWTRWKEACIQHGKYVAMMEAMKAQEAAK